MKTILLIILTIFITSATEVPEDENMDPNAYDVICAILINTPIAVCKLINYKVDSIVPSALSLLNNKNDLDTFYQYKFKVNNFIIGKSLDSVLFVIGSIKLNNNDDWYIILNNNRKEYYANNDSLRIGYYKYSIPELLIIIQKIQKDGLKTLIMDNKENQISKILKKCKCKKG